MDRGEDAGESCISRMYSVFNDHGSSLKKLLEQMPPIKVFVGLDAVRASAEEVPALPTREELKQWLAEHDRIEKETEVFDSGELRKLKRITKGVCMI